MSEFGDRMNAQRRLLQVVNSWSWREDLFGLSSQSIARWADGNSIERDSEIVRLLLSVAERLSFLASRSQAQVTDEYRRLSSDVATLTEEVEHAVKRAAA